MTRCAFVQRPEPLEKKNNRQDRNINIAMSGPSPCGFLDQLAGFVCSDSIPLATDSFDSLYIDVGFGNLALVGDIATIMARKTRVNWGPAHSLPVRRLLLRSSTSAYHELGAYSLEKSARCHIKQCVWPVLYSTSACRCRSSAQ